ncbi:MAG TPA: heme-binding protein [Vicinamibacteria bacterium]|nr:heme-binding protein [Vicinamibacteria bacterium]
MRGTFTTITMAALLAVAGGAHAQTTPTRGLTLEGARGLVAAAEAKARADGAGGAIAVVDAGGHLLALARLDGTFPAAAEVATGKARTAALFRRPTKFLEDVVNQGRAAMTTLPGVTAFTPLQGGVPVVAGGEVVGAIGVSGASSAAHDEEIAQAAVAGFDPGRAVSHLGAKDVEAAFAAGRPLLETGDYKVHASRREGPGQAEVHDRDTDVIRVLSGTAVLVTGGKVTDPKTAGPGEIRGTAIEGGETRALKPGDVVVVPHGVPHWFREVPGPLTYYVVKVP